MSLAKAAATVGSLTLLSRIGGFIRDMLVAAFLGAGPAADAFFVSFRLANLFRQLFGEGAFNAGFVPLFARTLEGEGKAEGRAFAIQAFSVMATVLTVIVLLGQVFMPWVVSGVAAGFEPGDGRYDLAVELTRITFPYLALICLAALAGGVLNTLGHFGIAAFTPILLNLVMIAAVLIAAVTRSDTAYALAWGVTVSGVVQLGWLLLACERAGMGLRWRMPRVTPRIRRLFALVLPGVLSTGLLQINLVVSTWFASHLPSGAISWLFYAERLMQFPLGVVGVAISTALLPALSRALRADDEAQAHETQNRAIELASILIIPCTVALMVIALPIVQVLFQRGAFDAADSAGTAMALAALSAGLPAYVLIKVLAPGFFAREDTLTPVLIAAVCLVANIVLLVLLSSQLAHVGIALASALSNWLNAILLAVVLHRRGLFHTDARLRRRFPRLLVAGGAMAAVLWFAPAALAGMPGPVVLIVASLAGGLAFFAVAQLTGGADLREVMSMVRRRKTA